MSIKTYKMHQHAHDNGKDAEHLDKGPVSDVP